jgi:glycosyltransferase involved in cell wall biosynthesis
VAHAVAATKQLVRSGCDLHLSIVGGGDELENLKAAARDPEIANRVTFTGSVSEAEKNAALRQAHLLLHTSIREGWGLNVIEANAMGTPAIVYPVAGLVDSTVHNQTGLITPAETPEALAQTILGLLAHPERYEQLRKAAWERSKTFLWSHVLPPACDWLESCARAESGVVQRAKNR